MAPGASALASILDCQPANVAKVPDIGISTKNGPHTGKGRSQKQIHHRGARINQAVSANNVCRPRHFRDGIYWKRTLSRRPRRRYLVAGSLARRRKYDRDQGQPNEGDGDQYHQRQPLVAADAHSTAIPVRMIRPQRASEVSDAVISASSLIPASSRSGRGRGSPASPAVLAISWGRRRVSLPALRRRHI